MVGMEKGPAVEEAPSEENNASRAHDEEIQAVDVQRVEKVYR